MVGLFLKSMPQREESACVFCLRVFFGSFFPLRVVVGMYILYILDGACTDNSGTYRYGACGGELLVPFVV